MRRKEETLGTDGSDEDERIRGNGEEEEDERRGKRKVTK